MIPGHVVAMVHVESRLSTPFEGWQPRLPCSINGSLLEPMPIRRRVGSAGCQRRPWSSHSPRARRVQGWVKCNPKALRVTALLAAMWTAMTTATRPVDAAQVWTGVDTTSRRELTIHAEAATVLFRCTSALASRYERWHAASGVRMANALRQTLFLIGDPSGSNSAGRVSASQV